MLFVLIHGEISAKIIPIKINSKYVERNYLLDEIYF